MRAYALMELGDSQSIDLLLREEMRAAPLRTYRSDVPAWAGLFYFETIEFDERDVSTS